MATVAVAAFGAVASDDGGRPRPHFKPDGVPDTMLFSPDSRWLAVYNKYSPSQGFTQLWGIGDTLVGERARILGGGAPLAFSADSNLIATTYWPGGGWGGMTLMHEGQNSPWYRLLVFDVNDRPSMNARHTFEVRRAPKQLLFVGNTLVGVDADGTARVWDLASDTLLRKEEWGTANVAYDARHNLLAIEAGGKLTMRNAETRKILTEVEILPEVMVRDRDPVSDIAFSPDAKLLAVSFAGGHPTGPKPSWESDLVLFDTASLAVRREFSHTRFVAFLPDGRLATRSRWITALRKPSAKDAVWLRKAGSYNMERTLPADTDALYPSPDGRLVLAVSGGVVRFLSQDDWTTTAFWLPVAAANVAQPLIVTPDGMFDGDPGNWAHLSWEFADDPGHLVALDRFVKDAYRPGLLAEVIRGRIPQRGQGLQRLDRRPPELELSLSGPPPMFSSPSIDLAIRVVRAPAGARDLRLFRNGVMIWRRHGELRAGGDPVVATVPVVDDQNQFTAYAFNRDDVKGPDATFAYQAVLSPGRGTAWIVAFGVDQYTDPEMRLRYAVSDARSFATELKRSLARTRQWDDVQQVALVDSQVTRASILAAIRRLAGKGTEASNPQIAEIGSAHPIDTVFLFFSGHGVTLGNHFYVLPYDVAASAQQIQTAAVSDTDLEQALESLDARQIVIIIDACHSGQVLEAEEARRGPLNAPGLAQLAYEKGMYVLVASQARQQALEVTRLGHGLLTYALLDGLGVSAAAADTDPRDGVVDLAEWLEGAAQRVTALHVELTARASRAVTPDAPAGGVRTAEREPQRARLYRRVRPELKLPVIVDLAKER